MRPNRWTALATYLVIAPSLAVAQTAAPVKPDAPAPDASKAMVPTVELPEKIVLVGGALGCVKYCECQGDNCVILRGYAPEAIYPTKMQVSFATRPVNDLYRVSIIVPLGVQLDAGFAVTFGTPTAYIRTYKVCTATSGCGGEVLLTAKAFDEAKSAKVIDVIVKGGNGRQVTLEGPLEGFAAALTKAPDAMAAVLAKQKEIDQQLASEIEANRAKREDAAKKQNEEAVSETQSPAAPSSEPPAAVSAPAVAQPPSVPTASPAQPPPSNTAPAN